MVSALQRAGDRKGFRGCALKVKSAGIEQLEGMTRPLTQCPASWVADRMPKATRARSIPVFHVMPTRDDRKCLPTSAAGQFRGQRIPMHSQGYRRKHEGQPHFLIAPGNSSDMPTTTRNPSYSRWLYSLKKTRAPVDLLQALKLADGAHRCRNVGMIVGGMLCWSKLRQKHEDS